MTGVGLLCYEVLRVSYDHRNIVTQVRFIRRLNLLSQVHVSSFIILYGLRNLKGKKLCYLCKRERFHRNRQHILKVRTNLYANNELATIIYNRFLTGVNLV